MEAPSRNAPISMQKTFESEDDKKWKREVARRHTGKIDPDVPETGPACVRCRHWIAPAPKGRYGDCQVVWMVSRGGRGGERGQIVGPGEIRGDWEMEPLACGPAFFCRSFRDRTALEEAA